MGFGFAGGCFGEGFCGFAGGCGPGDWWVVWVFSCSVEFLVGLV